LTGFSRHFNGIFEQTYKDEIFVLFKKDLADFIVNKKQGSVQCAVNNPLKINKAHKGVIM